MVIRKIANDSNGRGSAYTILALQRRPSLWPLIRAIPGQPVPARFATLVQHTPDEGIWREGDTQTDTYDQPLRCVFVRDLLPLAAREEVQGNTHNRAAWAYLAQMPEDMRVALYWT